MKFLIERKRWSKSKFRLKIISNKNVICISPTWTDYDSVRESIKTLERDIKNAVIELDFEPPLY